MDEKIKKDMKEASEKYVIKLSSNEILNAYELKQEKKRNKVFDIKKLLIPGSALLTTGLALALVLPFVLKNNDPTTPTVGGIPGISNPTIVDTETANQSLKQEKIQRLAFEATTAVEAASNFEVAPLSMVKRAFSNGEKENIKEVLPSIDLLLTNKSTFESTVGTSSKEGYSYELNVSYLSIEEEEISYKMYFNILKEDNKREDDEITKTIFYSGVTSLLDKEYSFLATLEEEVEDNETEVELSMILFLNDSKTDYIKVEQEKETESYGENEESFEYKIYKNNRLEKEFKIETEIERFDSEIEVEINDNEYYIELKEESERTIFTFFKEESDDYSSDEKISFEKIKTRNEETQKITVTYVEI